MEVVFASKRLRDACADPRELVRRWGKEGAKKVRLRLQQLGAAPTLEDMRSLPGRCHELTGDRKGELAVDAHQPYRIVFRPTDDPPRKADGGLDWAVVESITVIEIVDYH